MLDDGLDFRDEHLWAPLTFGAEKILSPLVWAVSYGCLPAARALVAALFTLGDTDFINRIDPNGQLPLVDAAGLGSLDTCTLLTRAGADVLASDRSGACPLWAILQRNDQQKGPLVAMLLVNKLSEALGRRRAEVVHYLHRPMFGGLTPMQLAVMQRADYLVKALASFPMQLNLVQSGPTPLRSVCEVRCAWCSFPLPLTFLINMVRQSSALNKLCGDAQRPETGDAKDDLLRALVRNDPALAAALTERDCKHGLTLLGQAVAWGHEGTVCILAAACRCA